MITNPAIISGTDMLLHGGNRDALAHIGWMWAWEPSIFVGCALLLLGYTWVQGFRLTGRWPFFTLGVLVLLFALVSPLHVLGERYLFSAHMIQHLLLVLAVPPLLLHGTPAWLFRRVLANPWASRVERVLGSPVVAWALFTVNMWSWHVPALFNATLQNHNVHILEHLLFLVTGTIFWWPVLHPLSERRQLPLPGVVFYMFLAAAASSVLGIVLTFAPPGLYPAYVHPDDTYGILAEIRGWGLWPAVDQQLAGMGMWVPGCVAYVVAALVALGRWFALPDESEAGPEREAQPVQATAISVRTEEG